MMPIKYLPFLIIFCSCANNLDSNTIPTIRKTVKSNPVASYVIPMGDPKLDRKFGTEIYETSETFKFKLVLYNDGTVVTDTLEFPNLGFVPVVQVKPGTEKLSCIIGFLDNKKVFREYKMLSIQNDKLMLTTLKRYYTDQPKQ